MASWLALQDQENQKDKEYEVYGDRVKCPLCTKTFSQKYLIPRHIRIEHDKKISACNICGALVRNLHTHTRTKHGVESQLKCSICLQVSLSKASLKDHYRQEHGDICVPNNIATELQCPVCNIIIVNKRSLWHSHIFYQHMVPLEMFECPVKECKIRIGKIEEDYCLKKHLKSVHSLQIDKIKKCDRCPMKFLNSIDLEKHIKSQHPDNSFQCSICDKEFKCYSLMALHLYKNHKAIFRGNCPGYQNIAYKLFSSKLADSFQSNETNTKENLKVFPNAIENQTNAFAVEEPGNHENHNEEIILLQVENDVQNYKNIGDLNEKVIVIETDNFEKTNKDEEFIILDACNESFEEDLEDFVIVESEAENKLMKQPIPTHFIQMMPLKTNKTTLNSYKLPEDISSTSTEEGYTSEDVAIKKTEDNDEIKTSEDGIQLPPGVEVIETEENELIIEMEESQSHNENIVYESGLSVTIQPVMEDKTTNDQTYVVVEESFNDNCENTEVGILSPLIIEPSIENEIPTKNVFSLHHENINNSPKIHNSKVAKNPLNNIEKDPNKFQCPRPNCNSQFSRKDSVALHIRNVHESKLQKCSICNKEYTSLINLKTHIKSVHENTLSKCTFLGCEKVLSSIRQMKTHLRKHKQSQTKHQCNISGCNLIYKNLVTLNKHKKKCHSS